MARSADPILKTAGSKAYVTDASKKELNIIDLKAMTVERTVKLDEATVKMAVVTGTPEPSHADHSVNLWRLRRPHEAAARLNSRHVQATKTVNRNK